MFPKLVEDFLTAARRSGRFSESWFYAHCTLRVRCMQANCPRIIEKQQWPPNSADFNPLHGLSCLQIDE